MIGRIMAALSHASFSNLGSLYLGPGWFVRVGAPVYLAIMVAGALWIGVVALCAWRIARGGRLWLAGFAWFLGTGAYTTFIFPPTTDEPHYLVIAESLLQDGNIEVANEYAGGAFMKFYPASTIDPHTVVLPDGRMYSQHAAGLPLLILPGYALAGRWGALLVLAAVAGCLLPLLERIARQAGIAAAPAGLSARVICCTAPVVCGGTLVATDVPAATLLALGVAEAGVGEWTTALCAAGLPWLHPRYAVLAAGLLFLDLRRARRPGRRLAGWAMLAAVSGGMFFAVYHGPTLAALGNALNEQYPAPLASLPHRTLGELVAFRTFLVPALAGKLLDRNYGLLPYAPWYVLALAGGWIAWRKSRSVLTAGAPYLILTCLLNYPRVWGGSMYPGRTLVPLLPFVAVPLAAGLAWARQGGMRRGVMAVLVAMSLAQAWALTACPVLRYTSGKAWLAMHAGRVLALMPFNWFPVLLEH